MKCNELKKTLSIYMDRELPSEEIRSVAEHIRACDSCGRWLSDLEEIWQALDALPPANPSPYLYARLSRRLRNEQSVRKDEWFNRLLIPVSVTAVACLGFWLGSITGANGIAANDDSKTQNPIASTAYLDTFDDFPSSSFGEAYFTMAGQN